LSLLENRTALVVGGASGIGRAIATAYVKEGARVVVADRAEVSGFDSVPIDVTDEASVDGFYAKLPPLHAVVNIAGGFAYAPIADSPAKVLQQQISMNLVSCVLSCRAAVANFRLGGPDGVKRGGHIINISARPALNPRQGANMTAYTASKAAVAAFTVALAEELKNENISAIALAPSTIDTPVNRKDMPNAKHDTWVKPTAIAELIVAHCSLSETINSGALIPVYGKA